MKCSECKVETGVILHHPYGPVCSSCLQEWWDCEECELHPWEEGIILDCKKHKNWKFNARQDTDTDTWI